MNIFLKISAIVGFIVTAHLNAAMYYSLDPNDRVPRQVRTCYIYSGSSNLNLTKQIIDFIDGKETCVRDALTHKGKEYVSEKIVINNVKSNVKVETFNDGEINIQYLDSLRQKDVFIVQSVCKTNEQSVNDTLQELKFMINAARLASAHSITAVIPYFGYARQDRKTKPGVPISAALVAQEIENAGANHIITFDLHCGQIQGFFTKATLDNLPATLIFAPHIASLNLTNPVVVSPDAGGTERACKFKDISHKYGLNPDYAMIAKKRADAGVVESMDLVGSVKDKTVVIIDDMCDTGGTLIKAAEELLENGALAVYACFTHAVFSKDAISKLANSCFKQIVTTDTIPLRGNCPNNMVVLPTASMLADVIQRVQNGESVSAYLNS
jgi:ribose-phosphate pyrophosphokinase